MRKISIALFAFALCLSAFAKDKERVTVKVTERHDSNLAYSYAFVSGSTGIAQDLNLHGATFTLLLPNGDKAVVNCTSKFHERFAGPGNVRSCRVPLVDQFEAEFDGDKAKLFWSTSLDGKKTESETYKIMAVAKAGASTPTPSPALTAQPTPDQPTESVADQAKRAQQYADCLKAAVNNPSIGCQQ